MRWKFDTIREPWQHPLEAGGGGLWYPVSIDDEGGSTRGTRTRRPWGGIARASRTAPPSPGPVLYTDSLLVLDARSGRLLWHDQVTPHDIRDYDFEATPILATVEGRSSSSAPAKPGSVIAWDRRRERRRLGRRRSACTATTVGPLPPRRVTVCPGLFGGVETPMAYADGRLFVPVVDLCGVGQRHRAASR